MPVQAEAFKRSQDKRRWGHYLEQGLGKTAPTYADYVVWLQRGIVRNMVVVRPDYLYSTWIDEAAKCGLSLPMVTWPDRPQPETFPERGVFMIHPEALLYSGGQYLEWLMQTKRCMLVLDEPSVLRNHAGVTAKKMKELSELAPVIRICYGTPDPEDPFDLYMQLRVLGEIQGWNPYAFRNRFCQMGGYMGKQIKGRKNEEQLAEIMNRCSFRALKEDWWKDAPEKITGERTITMVGKQLQHYREMYAEFITLLNEGKNNEIEVIANMVITQMQKLQQIARGFVLVDGRPHDLLPESKNPALLAAQGVMRETRGKLIVFAHHTHAIHQLERALADWHPVVMIGGMAPPAVTALKRTFNDDPACRVIIAQQAVGARGHDLLGQRGRDRCSTTLFYENMYSNELRQQAEDRNHRWGQDMNCLYLDLIAAPADRHAVKLLREKREGTIEFAHVLTRSLIDAHRHGDLDE